jgi:hypothetical protein
VAADDADDADDADAVQLPRPTTCKNAPPGGERVAASAAIGRQGEKPLILDPFDGCTRGGSNALAARTEHRAPGYCCAQPSEAAEVRAALPESDAVAVA